MCVRPVCVCVCVRECEGRKNGSGSPRHFPTAGLSTGAEAPALRRRTGKLSTHPRWDHTAPKTGESELGQSKMKKCQRNVGRGGDLARRRPLTVKRSGPTPAACRSPAAGRAASSGTDIPGDPRRQTGQPKAVLAELASGVTDLRESIGSFWIDGVFRFSKSPFRYDRTPPPFRSERRTCCARLPGRAGRPATARM